tara:strand:+ start:686 stop:958 length:273 start_codon:yes stop_codon:yes gene_type:complete
MAEIRMTLEEYEALRRMISSERESEGASLADREMDGARKKRKKTARDRAMKKAIPIANERYKKQNGEFRKGRSQADVMRLANKLADEMMK